MLALLIAVLAMGAMSFLSGSPAHAADSTPTPTATAGSDSPESVQIWVRVAADKSNVKDVVVDVTGPSGFTAKVTTGADGKVLVGVPKPGDYVFTVDKSTLPDGVSPAGNPRTVTVANSDQGDPAYFLLVAGDGTPSSGSTSGGSTSTGGGSGSSSSSSDNSVDYGALVSNLIANGLTFGLLLALASIGISLIYGTTGLSNFAHGELITFGGLMGYLFSGIFHLPTVVALVAAFVLGGAFGSLQDLGLWKPLRKRGVALIPLMIVSIGLSLALRYFFQFLFGPDQLVLPSNNASALKIGAVNFKQIDLISIGLSIVLLLAVAFILTRTRIGKATRAVSDNKSLAAASGINVERIIRIVWTGSGALAGLSGALIGYYQTLRWDTGASVLLLAFAAVTLGGFGTAFGALVGSIIIGLLVNLSTLILPSNVQNATALVVMILILLVRPQGIFGRRERIG
jgi:branched-chain amino acid transport system permease protein